MSSLHAHPSAIRNLNSKISNINRTEWSTIQGVIGRVIFKLTEPDYPWIIRYEDLLPINLVNNKMRESQSWNIYECKYKSLHGPVSFTHFSSPVEAGQLTWSLFFHSFWLVIMCYVVIFHWLMAFATWFPLVLWLSDFVSLQAPSNRTGQIELFWSYNSKIKP